MTASHALVPGLRLSASAGLTVFFILSGYLITNNLLAESNRSGQVSLLGFYRRRIVRLMPAMLAALIIGSLLALLAGYEFRALLEAVALCLACLSNFAPERLGPFSAYWSLAMEGQFYLVWPVLFVVLRMLPRFAAMAMMVVAVGLSLVARFSGEVDTLAGYRAAYYGPASNIWALILGAAIAMGMFERPNKPLPLWLGPVSLSAVLATPIGLMILTGFREEADAQAYLSRLAVGPVVAVFAVVLLVREVGDSEHSMRVLNHPMLVFCGRISYGLYLWHALLMSLVIPHFGASRSTRLLIGIGAAGAAVGAASLSFHRLEEPMRKRWATAKSSPQRPRRRPRSLPA